MVIQSGLILTRVDYPVKLEGRRLQVGSHKTYRVSNLDYHSQIVAS